MQELIGHTSEDTAYMVEDYPYSFTLRTQIRYWIQTRASHGQRLVTRTRNPKRAGEVWNAPKAGTYAPIRALYLADNGHVHVATLNEWPSEAQVDGFLEAWPHTCALERNRGELDVLRARARAMQRMTWTIKQAGEVSLSATSQRSVFGEVLAKYIGEELVAIRQQRGGQS